MKSGRTVVVVMEIVLARPQQLDGNPAFFAIAAASSM